MLSSLCTSDSPEVGPALNVVVMSEVQRSYSPAGQALMAAAVPGPEALSPSLSRRVGEQLARWLGASTADLTHLRTDVIPMATDSAAAPGSPPARRPR